MRSDAPLLKHNACPIAVASALLILCFWMSETGFAEQSKPNVILILADDMIHFTDVLPTLIDLCELKPPSDLNSDPTESRDVSREHPQRVSRMAADLEAWSTEIEEDRRRP